MTSTAAETRESVATAIREVVPEKWTVYAWPPATESLPCVIVGPRPPYRERPSGATAATFRLRSLGLRLTLLHAAAAGEKGASVIDGVLDDLLAALDTLDAQDIAWERVSSVGDVVSRGGVECIAAAIDLAPIAIT